MDSKFVNKIKDILQTAFIGLYLTMAILFVFFGAIIVLSIIFDTYIPKLIFTVGVSVLISASLAAVCLVLHCMFD